MIKAFYLSICTAVMVLICVSCNNSSSKEEPANITEVCKQDLKDGIRQYQTLMQNVPADSFPRTFENDKLITSGSGWWCSGFYPGTLLNLYEQTKDESLYEEALDKLDVLKKEQFNTHTHDLGFMMYCSFGTALKLDPKDGYRDILINSAKSLSTRFNPTVGCIRSWDSKENDFLVIIDNMMNLELLFWAAEATGDSSYYKIAVTHANTTINNHFRSDYSSYHVLNYNPETGAVQEKKTAQGYADESAWARGQVWGLYGFTVTYRYTQDKKYLDQARHIADFVLNNPNMPKDYIPYWDFNAPNIPEAKRDASAAAILASALMELQEYVSPDLSKKYVKIAGTIIKNLSKPEYKAEIGTNGGFILKHGVGHFPANSEVDVPLTYADYYFVEAMKRYLEHSQN